MVIGGAERGKFQEKKEKKILSTFVDLAKVSMLIQFCKFITIISQDNVIIITRVDVIITQENGTKKQFLLFVVCWLSSFILFCNFV